MVVEASGSCSPAGRRIRGYPDRPSGLTDDETMRDLAAEDPADVIVAWEAVEDLLAEVPECRAKSALRMVAAGLRVEEIADRFALGVDEVEVLLARARVLVVGPAPALGPADGPAAR